MRGNDDLPSEIQVVADGEDGIDSFLERIYFAEMKRRAQSAVMTWILIANKTLPKDIVQKISNDILKTSKQPKIWGWK